jgi:hypothetical protein
MTKGALSHRTLLPFWIAACTAFCQAQTGATTRIEEIDGGISYSGNWYTNSSSLHSGGRAVLTNAIGAKAVVTFTGTGISWIGVLDPWAGMAAVYLDGTLNTVDTYGAGTLYQQALFSVSGLANGPHTLSIEVTHMRDANGLGSWVWIDAFIVENGSGVAGGFIAAPGRSEQNNPALTYTGSWLVHASAAHSGGSALLAIDKGSRVTVTFDGSGISWNSYLDEWSGIARVYVDGLLSATVDTYRSPAQAQAAVYAINGLGPGTHTLTVEVTGTRNPTSGGSWIWVDSFDVEGSESTAKPPRPVEVKPGAGKGVFQTFVFTFSDPAGWQNVAAANVLINDAAKVPHACSITFMPSGTASGKAFLMDDAGTIGGPDSILALPGAGSVGNSQCRVTALGSSASWAGEILTLTLAITFSDTFAGNKVLFLSAQDKSSGMTGWQPMGTWAIPGSATEGPLVGGVSPARSNTLSEIYEFTFTDTAGVQDIVVASVLINNSLDGQRACYVAFVPSGPTAGDGFLVDDIASSYQRMTIPGSGRIANSQCSVSAIGSTVIAAGNTLTMRLAITFTRAFTGNRIVFAELRSTTLGSNWQAVGTVTVP